MASVYMYACVYGSGVSEFLRFSFNITGSACIKGLWSSLLGFQGFPPGHNLSPSLF